jgi:hypothetical protein
MAMPQLYLKLELDNQDEFLTLQQEVASWIAGAEWANLPSNPGLSFVPLDKMPACVHRLTNSILNHTDAISKQACKTLNPPCIQKMKRL